MSLPLSATQRIAEDVKLRNNVQVYAFVNLDAKSGMTRKSVRSSKSRRESGSVPGEKF